MAIVWACKRFHAYLYGPHLKLMTDHKSLECIFSPKSKTCTRIERWLLRLQPYKLTVKYISGSKNVADCLSLLPCSITLSEDRAQTEDYVKWVAQESTLVVLTTRKIERVSEYEAEFRSVRECLLNGMRWNSRSICLCERWNPDCDTKATSSWNCSNEATFTNQSVLARHR